MAQLKDLLTHELQDLLHAETQLLNALPKMTQAARNPRLKECFEKHRVQTEQQIARLQEVFEMMGEDAKPKACRAMQGLIEEGQEVIQEHQGREDFESDLALITAAQKVEHYEISGYGSARTIARQLGLLDAYKLLSHSLGEEEAADHLLTEIAKPLIQQAAVMELQPA